VSRTLAKRAAKRAAREIGRKAKELAKDSSRRLFQPALRAELNRLDDVRRAAHKKMREIATDMAENAGNKGWTPLGDMPGGDVYTGAAEFLGIRGGVPAVSGKPAVKSVFDEGSGLLNDLF